MKETNNIDSKDEKIAVGVILNPALEADRKKIINEHKTITHLAPPDNDFLRVFKTATRGLGVMAFQVIEKDQIICRYHGKKSIQKKIKDDTSDYDEVTKAIEAKKKQITQGKNRSLSEEEQERLDEYANQVTHTIGCYAFVLKETKGSLISVLGHQDASIASLVNCSWNGFANVAVKIEKTEIQYVAYKNILEGEELLIDYGINYLDSVGYEHSFPIGMRSIENFITQNLAHYTHSPILLSETERAVLDTQASHLLVPDYYFNDKERNYKFLKDHQINSWPVIEMIKEENGTQLKPLHNQQFFTILMYACLKENKNIITKLIKKRACVNFVTKNNRSAWSILSAKYNHNADVNQLCEKLLRAIYNLYKNRGWSAYYDNYVRKNLHETASKQIEIIFNNVLIPRVKNKKSSRCKKITIESMASFSQEATRFEKSEIKFEEFNPCQFFPPPPPPEDNLSDSSEESFPVSECNDGFLHAFNRNRVANFLWIQEPITDRISGKNKRKSRDLDVAPEPSEKKLSVELHKNRDQLIQTITNKDESALRDILSSISKDELFDVLIDPLLEGINVGWTSIGMASGYENGNVLNLILNHIDLAQRFALLNAYQPTGSARGLTSMAIAIKKGHPSTLETMLKMVEDQTQRIALINTPQKEGTEEDLTPLTIAAKTYGKTDFLKILLNEVVKADRFDLISLPQSIGHYRRYSLLTIAIMLKLLPAVEAILAVANPQQRMDLIIIPQNMGKSSGLTAIHMAVKLWNLEILPLLLNMFPIAERLKLMESRSEDKENGLSAFDIAFKYKKLAGLKLMIERITPLMEQSFSDISRKIIQDKQDLDKQSTTMDQSFRFNFDQGMSDSEQLEGSQISSAGSMLY